jgi:hypothetical protein
VYAWTSPLNLAVLRVISANVDAARRPRPAAGLHGAWLFAAYVLYPPLYVAGPIMTFERRGAPAPRCCAPSPAWSGRAEPDRASPAAGWLPGPAVTKGYWSTLRPLQRVTGARCQPGGCGMPRCALTAGGVARSWQLRGAAGHPGRPRVPERRPRRRAAAQARACGVLCGRHGGGAALPASPCPPPPPPLVLSGHAASVTPY